MSVKHLEFLKVKNSKVLVVEVRPVSCLLDTPSGPVHTDKWMDYSHWKELRYLLMDIVDEYEEQRAIQEVKCNQPKCRTGKTMQVGYMFRHLPSCWCSVSFLTPRPGTFGTKDDDGGDSRKKLQDKGGRLENRGTCGEMLVISVILCDAAESFSESVFSQTSSSSQQHEHLKRRLVRALDRSIQYTSSISDYFSAPAAPGRDDGPSSVSSSAGGKGKNSSPVRLKTKSVGRNEESRKRRTNGAVSQNVEGYRSHANINPPTQLRYALADGDSLGGRIETDDPSYVSQTNRAKEIEPFKETCRTSELSAALIVKVESFQDMMASETDISLYGLKDVQVNVDAHRSENNNSEAQSDSRIMRGNKEMPFENLLSVSQETSDDCEFFEVKEEINSDSGSQGDTSSQDCNVSKDEPEHFLSGRSDVEGDGVESEAECMNWLASSEHDAPVIPSLTANLLEEVQEESVGDGTEDDVSYVSYDTVLQCSSPRSRAQGALQVGGDVFLAENDEDHFGMEDGESESLHRIDRKYGQVRNGKRKKFRTSSSSSDNPLDIVGDSSEAIERAFLYEDIEEVPVEVQHNTNVLVHFDSCEESGDDVSETVHTLVEQDQEVMYQPDQDQDADYGLEEDSTHDSVSLEECDPFINLGTGVESGVLVEYQGGMTSYEEEYESDDESEKNLSFSSVEVCSPEKLPSKTKAPQGLQLKESLVLQDQVSPEVVRYSSDVYQQASQGQLNESEEAPRSTSDGLDSPEMLKSSKKIVKFTEHHQPPTPYTLNEDVVGSDPCRNPLWLRMKHSNKKKVRVYTKSISKSTSPELECIAVNMVCPSTSERLLLTTEGPRLAGNSIHKPTVVLEKLPFVKKRSASEDHLLQVQQDEAIEEGLDVGEDGYRKDKCPQSPSDHMDLQSVSSTSVEEDPGCTSSQKSKEERKDRVQKAKSTKYLYVPVCQRQYVHENREDVDTRSDSQCRQRKDVTEMMMKKRKEKFHESSVEARHSPEIHDNTTSFASDERDSAGTDDNSELTRGKEKSSLRFWRFKRLRTHEADLQVDCSGDEATMDRLPPSPRHAAGKQRNAGTANLKGSEKEDSEIESGESMSDSLSPPKSYQSTPVRILSNSDNAADLSDADEPARQVEHIAATPNKGDPERGTERLTWKRRKRLKGKPKNHKNVPVNKKTPSKVKQDLLSDEDTMASAPKAGRNVQQSMGETSEFSVDGNLSLTSRSSIVSRESVSPETKPFRSEEYEEKTNLRRSQRIIQKPGHYSRLYSEESNDEDTYDWPDSNNSSKQKSESLAHKHEQESKRAKRATLRHKKNCTCSHKYDHEEIEGRNKCSSEQTETFKTRKRQHPKSVKWNTPEKQNSQMERQGSDQHRKLVRRKGATNHSDTGSGQETSPKPSSSKQSKQCSGQPNTFKKTEDRAESSNLKNYNDIWNFSLKSKGNKKGSNINTTTRQKGKKPSPKKSQATFLEGSGVTRRKDESDSKSSAKNHFSSAIDDDFYWLIQGETERLNDIMKDSDEAHETKENSDSNLRKSSRSGSRNKQSVDRRYSHDEECLILNEEDSAYNLHSLKTSYNILRNMSQSDLERRLDDSIPYLEKVMRGIVPNLRHKLYKEANPELQRQQDYVYFGPFTSDQSLYVLDLLKKKLGHLDKLIGKGTYDVLFYRCRVLMPTFFTRIVMENEKVSMKEAHRLLAKFSLSREIADDLQANEQDRI